MRTVILLICAISFFGCDKQAGPGNSFEVVSAGKGIDCGLVLIDFQQTDIDRLETITGENGELRYFAFGLDPQFEQDGKAFVVTVRKTREDELFACTAQGPQYPWITILTAKEKP